MLRYRGWTDDLLLISPFLGPSEQSAKGREQLPAVLSMSPGQHPVVGGAQARLGSALQLLVFLSETSPPSSTLIMATVTSSTGAWQREHSLLPTLELSSVSLSSSWGQNLEALSTPPCGAERLNYHQV